MVEFQNKHFLGVKCGEKCININTCGDFYLSVDDFYLSVDKNDINTCV